MSEIILASGHKPDTPSLEEAGKILRERGHKVSLCRDGVAVADLLSRKKVDVLVLGFPLGGYDGYELLDIVKNIDVVERPKVIWLSIFTEYGTPRIVWQDPTITAFAIPPYNSWQLVSMVEQLLYRA